jgi:hypothetical protein
LAGGRPILIGSAGLAPVLLQPILLGRTVRSIFTWCLTGCAFMRCLTGCAILLLSTIQAILTRRLLGRTVLIFPFRARRLFGFPALLLRVALGRLALSIRSLPGSFAAAAVLRCLAGAVIWPLVVDTGRIVWRHFLCRGAALLLRRTFLLSHRSTRRSHERDDCARYQQIGCIHFALLLV